MMEQNLPNAHLIIIEVKFCENAFFFGGSHVIDRLPRPHHQRRVELQEEGE